MTDGYHLTEDYERGYRHGWVEALEAALEAVDQGGRAEKAIRELLEQTIIP